MLSDFASSHSAEEDDHPGLSTSEPDELSATDVDANNINDLETTGEVTHLDLAS
jgi:hypothetical protein